jgi:hypothetical protein
MPRERERFRRNAKCDTDVDFQVPESSGSTLKT